MPAARSHLASFGRLKQNGRRPAKWRIRTLELVGKFDLKQFGHRPRCASEAVFDEK